MKRITLPRVSGIILGLTAIGFSTGCRRGPADPVIDEGLLTRYSDLAHPPVKAVASSEIDCYLDYSRGMGEGMRATATINAGLKDFLGGRNVTYYKVGASEDPPRVDITSPAANFNDLNNYTDPMSRLKVALGRMTAKKDRVSLFVTDFERIEDGALRQKLAGAPAPHPIDASAWGQNDFKEWLLSGNRIDIFATPFQKPDYYFDQHRSKTYPNWVYTIVFTPASIAGDERAFKSSVASFLMDAYGKDAGKESRHFSYTANAFPVGHGGAAPGGDANESAIVQEFAAPQDRAFQFYRFTSKDLLAFQADPGLQDKRIINKLSVKPQVPFLRSVEFGIKVYDVTQPLTDLFRVATAPAAEVVVDIETGKSKTTGAGPAALAFDPGQPADGTFDVVYNVSSGQIGIKLKPDFVGVPRDTVYRVDIVAAAPELRDFTESDEVMVLNYRNGYQIRSLAESIRFAIRDVAAAMDGRVLYTLYIKIDA